MICDDPTIKRTEVDNLREKRKRLKNCERRAVRSSNNEQEKVVNVTQDNGQITVNGTVEYQELRAQP